MDEDVPVPLRVQVVPLGFEYARLREPVFRWRADKVVAIDHVDAVEVPYLDEFLAELEANERVELEVRTCDIFDLYDALGTVAGAVHDHRGEEVFVNLSGGSKITAVAGMIACMATGATPFYAKPTYEGGRQVPERPLHDELESVFALPTYPIDAPSRTHVAFLRYVADRSEGEEAARGRYRGASKKELIEFALAEEFEFAVESEASSEKGFYRLLDRHVLDPLAERGDVTVERVGREKYVTPTDAGRDTLRAFGYLIDG